MNASDTQFWPSYFGVQSTLPTGQHLYDAPFTFGSYKPEEIGCLSRTAGRTFPNDSRNKQYLRSDAQWVSDVHLDLLAGYPDRYIRTTVKRRDRSVNHILTWLMECGLQQQAAPGWGTPPSTRPVNFDFVARRGHLVTVLTTPHVQHGWKLAVTLFRGTYYFLEIEDHKDPSESEDRTDYIGHKFEQYMTSDTPGQAPNPSQVLDVNEAFYSLVKASVKNHSLLLSAEVDSVDTSVHYLKAPSCYVELKTSPLRGVAGNVSSIKKLHWWAQSFLGGIPRIIVGFKRDERTVVKCKTFDVTARGLTQRAPTSAEASDYWKPQVCFNFLDAFLSFVKKVVTEDNHTVVYFFSWNKGDDVRYHVKRGQEHCFLLPEYVQRLAKQ
ncbi:hypothetical protein NDU88_000784 [Pleurodeles waltl]|uniref:Decapping nuclease n=1 Tax=Pleurodeles waltl TaxID=8319 RepID=A0AAV7Q448_PLEWA|nr:hypothetical protein NDU88_000784 [Pleurodeles waltl]